jgi:hypothetical protein
MPSLKEAVEQAQETDELRSVLVHTQRQLARAKAKTDDLIDAVYHAVRDSIVVERSMPAVARPPKDKRHKDGEPALWHLTDWQGGKQTTTYNREVMRRRVLQFTDKAKLITDIQRTDHPVRSCHILYGGDMVEGLFQFPQQPFQVDATLFAQWAAVTELLIDTTRIALGIYDSVTVIAEWGNHGRIGSKRDAVPSSDNFDRMCYEAARTRLAGETRLTWEDCPEDIQRVEIGNYRALLLHGDEAGRMGYVSDTTFLGYLNGLKAGAYDWAFRDAYTGHYHKHNERAMGDGTGAWYQTGSTESDNRYARDKLGSSMHPSQRLHFIDPSKGHVTAQFKIRLT